MSNTCELIQIIYRNSLVSPLATFVREAWLPIELYTKLSVKSSLNYSCILLQGSNRDTPFYLFIVLIEPLSGKAGNRTLGIRHFLCLTCWH